MSTYNLSQTAAEIDSAIGKVHNADTSPTQGSTSMVTSGGVYTAVNNIGVSALPITTEAQGIANYDNDSNVPTNAAVKDYVDSNTVANYTGGESVTLSAGLIMKFGSGSFVGDGTNTVTFSTNFPTGIKTVLVTVIGNTIYDETFPVYNLSVSGFSIKNVLDKNRSYQWTAVGY